MPHPHPLDNPISTPPRESHLCDSASRVQGRRGRSVPKTRAGAVRDAPCSAGRPELVSSSSRTHRSLRPENLCPRDWRQGVLVRARVLWMDIYTDEWKLEIPKRLQNATKERVNSLIISTITYISMVAGILKHLCRLAQMVQEINMLRRTSKFKGSKYSKEQKWK